MRTIAQIELECDQCGVKFDRPLATHKHKYRQYEYVFCTQNCHRNHQKDNATGNKRKRLLTHPADKGLENKSLIRMGEAASLYSVSHATLRRWDAEGLLECYRTPGQTRLVVVSSLEKILSIPENLLTKTGKNIKSFGKKYPLPHSKLKEIQESDFNIYILRARQRGHECDIDLKYLYGLWIEQNGHCPLTGWELSLQTRNRSFRLSMYHASLDRIDPNKGYIKGNVRFISIMANLALNNKWDDNDIIEFCKAVADNNLNKM